MARFEIDVDPCDHLTSDAIGRPGQRVFYLQAYQDQRTITVIIEKAQLHSLAIGVEQFLAQIDEQNPDLSEASGDYVEDVMRINPPVDPLFRVGEVGLGYDKERDKVVLFVKELLTEEDDPEICGGCPLLGFSVPIADAGALGRGSRLTRTSRLPAMWTARRARRSFLPKEEWAYALIFERLQVCMLKCLTCKPANM